MESTRCSFAATGAPLQFESVGASNDTTKIPGMTLESLLKHGVDVPVCPVHPRLEEVQGLKAYPTVEAAAQAEVERNKTVPEQVRGLVVNEYTEVDTIIRLLRLPNKPVRLARPRFFQRCLEKKEPMGCRQEIPDVAFLDTDKYTDDELRALVRGVGQVGAADPSEAKEAWYEAKTYAVQSKELATQKWEEDAPNRKERKQKRAQILKKLKIRYIYLMEIAHYIRKL